MKKSYPFSLILLFLLFSLVASAQTHNRCGADEYNRAKLASHPELKAKMIQLEKEYAQQIAEGKLQRTSNGTRYTIPVVVHVIHDPLDVAVGTGSNISNQRVIDQITILNEDYRKEAATMGYGEGVDTQIEFQLAERDPSGMCSSGIVRVPSALSVNHDPDSIAQEKALKNLSHWPHDQYLNLYVVHSMAGGVLGYATFPWLAGTPATDSLDGVVVIETAFGLSGNPLFGIGRTTTHELGHWLGLYHTFEGGCLNDSCSVRGDRVCDTPPQAFDTDPSIACSTASGFNSCLSDDDDTTSINPFRPIAMGGLGDQLNQIDNYMDYSADSCMSQFTPGQYTRMKFYLNSSDRLLNWGPFNLTNTGVKGLQHDFDSVGLTGGVNGKITAMTEWKSKGKLVVAGDFTIAGTIPVSGIATWDGTNWDSLPGAPNFTSANAPTSLKIFQGDLYVGGAFQFLGLASYLIKYNGSTWSKVTTNVDIKATSDPVRALEVYKGQLYVGGDFGQVNGGALSANRIASWDGVTWSRLGTSGSNGVTGSSSAVYSMTIWDGDLVIGGRFGLAMGIVADKVVRWNGSSFTSLNIGASNLSGRVNCLGGYKGRLYAGGNYFSVGGTITTGLNVYDGVSWTQIPGGGLGNDYFALEPFNGYLWVGGQIIPPGGPVSNIYIYDADTDTLGTVTKINDGMDGSVNALIQFNNELYVGGQFVELQGSPAMPFDNITKVHTVCENLMTQIDPSQVGESAERAVLYPNPVKDQFYIYLPEEWTNSVNTDFEITVFDLYGRNVLRAKIANSLEPVSVSQLNAGTYIYSVSNSQGEFTNGKFVIMR